MSMAITYGRNTTLASSVLGVIIFFLIWPFIAFDISGSKYVRGMVVSRPIAAVFGATLMVLAQTISQSVVYEELGMQDRLQTLFLLLGMMLLGRQLEREHVITDCLTYLLPHGNFTLRKALWRICPVVALTAALVTNDAACLLLAPLVVQHCQRASFAKHELETVLVAVSSSANIGSAATVFGNPQLAVIAAQAGLTLADTFLFVTPVVIIALILNTLYLTEIYGNLARVKMWIRTWLLPRHQRGDRTLSQGHHSNREGQLEIQRHVTSDGRRSERSRMQRESLSEGSSNDGEAVEYAIDMGIKLTSVRCDSEVQYLERHECASLNEGHTEQVSQGPSLRNVDEMRLVEEGVKNIDQAMPSDVNGAAVKAIALISQRSEATPSNLSACAESAIKAESPIDRSGGDTERVPMRGSNTEGLVIKDLDGAGASLNSRRTTTADDHGYGASARGGSRTGDGDCLSSASSLQVANFKATSSPGTGPSEAAPIGPPLPQLIAMHPSVSLSAPSLPLPSGSHDHDEPTLFPGAFRAVVLGAMLLVVVLLAIPHSVATFDLGLVPVGMGAFCLIIDGLLNKRTASAVLSTVDWGLLVMFAGIFVWLRGFEETSLPTRAWDGVESYMDITSFTGTLLYVLFVLVGSNIMSNVPLVVLLVDRLASISGSHFKYAAISLAWLSTVAGNMTLFGSICNLIAAEKGKPLGVDINSVSFLRLLPCTLLVTILGQVFIFGVSYNA